MGLALLWGILLVVAGGVFCYFKLGQLEDPEFSVKTAVITTTYPGASAEVVAATVGIPIEQAVNGVEGSVYMSSTSSSDGSYTLTITFDVGTNLNTAVALVQNLVQVVAPPTVQPTATPVAPQIVSVSLLVVVGAEIGRRIAERRLGAIEL